MGLDFTLSEEQLQLRAGAREFADGVLTQVAGALEGIPGPEERFYAIRPFFQQMVDADFLKALIPDEYGGNKFSSLAFTLAAEELARVDINTPTAVLATGLGLQPIIRFGNDEQKARFLPQFVDGTARLAAFGFTEVSGGANWDSPAPKVGVQTFAELDGDEWVINGAKHYVTNGTGWNREGPDTLCLVCRTDPGAVQVAYDAMRLVGIDAYTDLTPIAGIMNDVLCFPVYDGGNMGVRRRQMHDMFRNPSYDPLAPAENRLSTSSPVAEAVR